MEIMENIIILTYGSVGIIFLIGIYVLINSKEKIFKLKSTEKLSNYYLDGI